MILGTCLISVDIVELFMTGSLIGFGFIFCFIFFFSNSKKNIFYIKYHNMLLHNSNSTLLFNITIIQFFNTSKTNK